jgi:hypothetical protein
MGKYPPSLINGGWIKRRLWRQLTTRRWSPMSLRSIRRLPDGSIQLTLVLDRLAFHIPLGRHAIARKLETITAAQSRYHQDKLAVAVPSYLALKLGERSFTRMILGPPLTAAEEAYYAQRQADYDAKMAEACRQYKVIDARLVKYLLRRLNEWAEHGVPLPPQNPPPPPSGKNYPHADHP